MKIAVLTKIPSPYQVELFDEIAKDESVALSVCYVRASDRDRSWSQRPLRHCALFLDHDAGVVEDALAAADLAVFSWYADKRALRLIARRAKSGKPWCFWGERPGFKHSGLAGRAYRRLRLWRLWLDSRVPIWGIGRWAIDGYAREFGKNRKFFHVPYVSNLSAFFAIAPRSPQRKERTVLFSGSLIKRKGVVELCEAFTSLSRDFPELRLLIMGSGPLETFLKKTFGSNGQITFLGFQDWDKLAHFYQQADLLCAPSRYDGWGLIIPEAMASGIPVIASTAMGAARELVVDGSTGWLVAPSDKELLATALRTAIRTSESTMLAMGAGCREVAREYDVGVGASRLIAAARESVSDWHSTSRRGQTGDQEMSLLQSIKRRFVANDARYRRIAFGPAAGCVMKLNLQHEFRLYLGLYERELRGSYRRLLKPGSKAFDIGGRDGYSALLIARNTEAEVISFESEPADAQSMQATFDRNPNLPLKSVSAFIGREGDPRTTLSVDQAAERYFQPDFMKIDVEGGEVDVLKGARRVLSLKRPTLLIEVHGVNEENECVEILEHNSYRIRVIDQSRLFREQRPVPHNRWLECVPN
jgi:glycosyltransferase involved in cell wall biosynthesis